MENIVQTQVPLTTAYEVSRGGDLVQPGKGHSQGRLNTDVPALPLIITQRLGGTHST